MLKCQKKNEVLVLVLQSCKQTQHSGVLVPLLAEKLIISKEELQQKKKALMCPASATEETGH